MNARKPLVFAAACIGMLFFGVALLSMGSLLPAIAARFQLDGLASGALVSILPFGVLAGSVVFGPVVDRFGYKLLLVVSALVMIAGLEALACAATVGTLRLAIFAIGFGGGMLNGGTNALVADISAGERGAKLSLLGVFFGLGALGMPVLLGALEGVAYSVILSRIGAVLLLPVIYFAVIAFPVPKQAQGFPLAQGMGLLRDGGLLLIAATLALQSGLEGVVNNWTTTYLESGRKLGPSQALFALSAFVAGMVVARLALAQVLRRVAGDRVFFVSMELSAFGVVMILAAGSSAGLAAFGFAVLGVGLAAGFPLLLGYVADLYPAISGTAFSVVLVIALLGNMGINYLVGVLSDVLGPGNLPLYLGACLVLQWVVAIAAIRSFKKRIAA
ncbi:MAG: MFS transporter [Gemmatimonadaceae bacterium]